MQGLLDGLARQIQQNLGDPKERMEACAVDAFDPELYNLLRRMGPEETKVLRAVLALAQGQKLPKEAPHNLLQIQHMLQDYESAQTMGRFIKVFWLVMAGLVGTVFTVVKALPDVVDWLRGVIR